MALNWSFKVPISLFLFAPIELTVSISIFHSFLFFLFFSAYENDQIVFHGKHLFKFLHVIMKVNPCLVSLTCGNPPKYFYQCCSLSLSKYVSHMARNNRGLPQFD